MIKLRVQGRGCIAVHWHGYFLELPRRSQIDVDGSQPSVVDLTAGDDDDDGDEDLTRGLIVPYGFWMRFGWMRSLCWTPSRNRKMRLMRALTVHAVRVYKGCRTRTAVRRLRKGESKRSNGIAQNSTKAVVVQRLQCRADSLMLMTKARELRAELLHDGSGRWADSDLPKLVGNSGPKWFERWRRRYSIRKKVTGMKLKVAWRKVKTRVCVLLTNIFRLREWWKICHGNKHMRWLSVDQKPCWWSDGSQPRRAPTVKENFAHTRSRYTITVPYYTDEDDEE